MKKLCNGKVKRIHPSPPLSSPLNFLAALPAAILTLAAALSPEEKEVLVYLLSDAAADMASEKKKKKKKLHQQRSHPPELGCGCFGCYKSFWERWNASPNHRLIHHVLDAVEGSMESQSVPAARRRRRRRGGRRSEKISPSAAVEVSNPVGEDGDDEGEDEEFDGVGEIAGGGGGGDGQSSVRRIVSFIGERVWGVWNY